MLSLLGSLRGGSSFVTNSLRFRSSASAYLSRTPSVAGNRQTWTWSAWVKRGSLTTGTIFGAGTGTTYTQFSFSGDALFFSNTVSAVVSINVQTAAVFRDPSAWYHIVLYVDTTQAVNTNGVRIYVNGVNQTLTFTNYTSGSLCSVNNAVEQALGRVLTTQYFDGYLTDVNFIDGQALTPASFGAIDSSTGVWAPRPYSGTYGTNGFYLKFANTSSVAALGNDSSGNNNTWTVNNVSLTAGATYDSMIDVPVNYSDGGNGRGNYCVLNPLAYDRIYASFRAVLSDGNLQAVTSAGGTGDYSCTIGTMGVSSGKWYWEMTGTAGTTLRIFGITDNTLEVPFYPGSTARSWGYYSSGRLYNNGSFVSYGATWTTNDVIGVALDLDAGTLVFYKNGVSQGTAATGLSGTFTPALSDLESAASSTIICNFGQRPFAYTPPAGFRALNTNNLPTPSIVNGANFMAATTYTGNAAARSLSNAVNSVSFQPDLVWIKSRTPAATNHVLFDSMRGASIYAPLSSTTIGPEVTNANTLTAFGADGFSLGTDTTLVNANANSYVAWQWKESTLAGLDVVTYTGTGVARTISHNLGKAPAMVIVKSRTSTADWCVYHASISATNRLLLSQTNNSAADSTMWNNTAPTTSVFSVGTNAGVNANTITYVAYCFAEIAGFSRFGSYTGNGSTDGPFVFCGFRPRFVMIKRTDVAVDWAIYDSARNTSNLTTQVILANSSAVEVTGTNSVLDFLSNGFKLKNAGSEVNATGGTYIFAAFAENPSKYALAR